MPSLQVYSQCRRKRVGTLEKEREGVRSNVRSFDSEKKPVNRGHFPIFNFLWKLLHLKLSSVSVSDIEYSRLLKNWQMERVGSDDVFLPSCMQISSLGAAMIKIHFSASAQNVAYIVLVLVILSLGDCGKNSLWQLTDKYNCAFAAFCLGFTEYILTLRLSLRTSIRRWLFVSVSFGIALLAQHHLCCFGRCAPS